MDARLSESFISYDGPAPLLVAATSDAGFRRVRDTAVAAGMRVGEVGIPAARDRLKQQASASAIWVELDQDCGDDLDALLDDIDMIVERRRTAAVICVNSGLIDRLGSRLFDSSAQFIIDADPIERATALAVAVAAPAVRERANDASSDPGAERLRQLSDEVSRIAATLARLSTSPVPPEPELRKPVDGDVPDVSVETVRSVIRARRLRARFFAEDLFADPAWDMLLDLLQAEIAQLRVPVSSLCIAAAVPATTALRWLKSMTDKGLFVRRADPHDGRRVFVELSGQASIAMRRYFAEVGRPAVV